MTPKVYVWEPDIVWYTVEIEPGCLGHDLRKNYAFERAVLLNFGDIESDTVTYDGESDADDSPQFNVSNNFPLTTNKITHIIQEIIQAINELGPGEIDEDHFQMWLMGIEESE